MAITITLHDTEAVFTCGALEASVTRLRQFLKDTDAQWGDMNNLHRGGIYEYRAAHATLIDALRAKGYPMRDRDILDDPIDTPIMKTAA